MKEKIINFRYIFYPFLAFFFGITMSRKLFAGSLEIILLVCFLLFALTIFHILKKSYRTLILLLAFFFVGNGFYFIGEKANSASDFSSPVSVVGRVTDNMIKENYYFEIVLDEVKIDGKPAENIRLTLKNCQKYLNIGDFVAFEGVVEKSKTFTLNSFNSSDYRSGVRYNTEVSYRDVVVSDGYTKFDEKVRLAVKDLLYKNMSEQNAEISYAVLFGDKSGVDQNIKSAYQNSGIIHVLTVSGLHIGFLTTLLYFILKLCKINQYVRFVITAIFIFFYAYLCGFAPSVMRAGIMALVMMSSKLFMRRYDILNSLGLAGFLICIFSPLSAFDLGFQMSFFCVYGIIVLAPLFTRFFEKFLPNKISTLLALSVSAQIGILPFLAFFGGNLNFLSIFANLIVVPFFSILYPFLFLVSILSTFLPFLSIFLYLPDFTFNVINHIASFFGNSFLSFNLSPIKTAVIAVYFVAIFAVGRFVMRRPLIRFSFLCACMLLMTITYGFYLIPKPNETSITYVGNKTNSSLIIENTEGQFLAIGGDYWLERYMFSNNIERIDGFVALDYLGKEKTENLAMNGVKTFIGNNENSTNKNFLILDNDTSYTFGKFKITFLTYNQDNLGVLISYNQQNIFVATEENFEYNCLSLKGISPNIVFAKSVQQRQENAIFASQFKENSDYSLAQNGNMRFYLNGENWIMRGID